jgi:Glycosyltransferases involved in cell wall biogenesis
LSKKPKFSIIVPVYNVEPYLSYCLNTIVEQTLRDIEIICVNDGSTDQSLKILQAYAKEDDRIKIINKPNGGLSSARNAALRIAGGEYLLFIDSDDMIKKHTCDRLYREVLQKAPDVIVFGTEVFPGSVVKPDRAWLEWALAVNSVYYDEKCINALFWERASKPYACNKCFKNSILKDNRIKFDEQIKFGEDMLFLFTVFSRINSVIYVPDKLYQYRYAREGSLMDHSRKDMEWKLKHHLKIMEKILVDWSEHDFIKGNEESLYIWCLEFIVNEISEISNKNMRMAICNRLKTLIRSYNLKAINRDGYVRDLETKLRGGLKN